MKRIIRRKVNGNNELPTYKILLCQIMVGEEQFKPTDYLNSDQEDYFHVLKEWKIVCEKDFLEEHSHLKEGKRHQKIYIYK